MYRNDKWGTLAEVWVLGESAQVYRPVRRRRVLVCNDAMDLVSFCFVYLVLLGRGGGSNSNEKIPDYCSASAWQRHSEDLEMSESFWRGKIG